MNKPFLNVSTLALRALRIAETLTIILNASKEESVERIMCGLKSYVEKMA
jgi:hypothetical protein